MEAQSGARLKYSVTQLCFSADGRGPEVTERLKTREEETVSDSYQIQRLHPCVTTA